jgi:hypothetical protein
MSTHRCVGTVAWGGSPCTKRPQFAIGQLLSCSTHLGKLVARAVRAHGIVTVREWKDPDT